MDWLNFLVGVHKRLNVNAAESDYAPLRTLSDVVHYVEARRFQFGRFLRPTAMT